MTRIAPISPSIFPKGPARPKPGQHQEGKPASKAVTVIKPAYQAATSRHIRNRPGPNAPFLTQYVDQHWPWPRNPQARLDARETAAFAYDTTDAAPLSDHRGASLNRKI